MSITLIKNGTVVSDGVIRRADVLIRDGVIADADFTGDVSSVEPCEVIDAEGCYVSPGLIDIHAHGGGGYDIMDCEIEAFRAISHTHLKNGTTTLVPTAVSARFEDILRLIEVYKQALPECPNMYGLHLEGPFISKHQKGAHKEHLLHAPTDEEIETLLTQGKGVIKRITAAPELDNMEQFAKKMTAAGVGLALGHSDATAEEALRAFANGFSHVTHLYSATPSVRKINQVVKAGVIEAAYLDDNVTVELIADGKHAAVHALQLAVKIKGVDKVALVTDALRPAGTDVTESYLGEKTPENRVIIEDGVAKLPDRSSFAGSIATANMLLARGVDHYGLSLADTVTMLTSTPASILGLEDRGSIRNGYVADVVVFDPSWCVKHVLLGGKEYV